MKNLLMLSFVVIVIGITACGDPLSPEPEPIESREEVGGCVVVPQGYLCEEKIKPDTTEVYTRHTDE